MRRVVCVIVEMRQWRRVGGVVRLVGCGDEEYDEEDLGSVVCCLSESLE